MYQPVPEDGTFDELLAALRPELLRFALWLTRDRPMAEDVVQETMLRAWKAQDSLTDRQALRPWLMTIIRREHSRLRQRQPPPATDIDQLIAVDDPQLAAIDGEEQRELRKAILQLPEDYRVPLLMQVMGGFSAAEIATELQLTQGAVLTRLCRAREKLRNLWPD
ncbi:MAG: sigma-70 family RNA polymerase sigma factor [Gammaproteobacteria bacterium]